MKEKIAFLLVLGFIFGTAAGSLHWFQSSAEYVFLVMLAITMSLVWVIREKSLLIRCVVFPCAFVLGFSHILLFTYLSDAGALDECIGKTISFRGVIVADPSVSEKSVGLTIKAQALGNQIQNCISDEIISGIYFRVQHPLYPVFLYGDEVEVRGVVALPENFLVDGKQSSFDYVGYLAAHGIYYLINRAQVKLVARDQGNFVVGNLQKIKRSLVSHIETTFAQPHGALVAGLLLGIKSSLGKDLQEDFQRVGLIHIIVLSGSNVTLIAQTIIRVFSFLPRVGGAVAGLIGITLFAFLAGTSPTVVRASVMASMAVCATLVWREYSVMRALLFAATAMVILNPYLVIFDPSFQLSFLATLGLVLFSPTVEKWFAWAPEQFGLREILTSSISTQLFMTPFLLYLMGQVSIVSLVVNIIVLPLVPYAMLCGFLGAVLSYIHPIVALPFTCITHLLLTFIFWIVQKHSQLPFASVFIDWWGIWHTVAFYICFTILILLSLRSKNSPQSPPSLD